LVETDYELLKDGFEGISNSDIYIKEPTVFCNSPIKVVEDYRNKHEFTILC